MANNPYGLPAYKPGDALDPAYVYGPLPNGQWGPIRKAAPGENPYASAESDYAEAKKANEERYQQQLGTLDSTYANLMKMNQTMSLQPQMQAIQDAYGQRTGGLNQDLMSRGLNNTTIKGSMQRGIDRDRLRMMGEAQNAATERAMGITGQFGLAKAGAIADRTDAYPNTMGYADLLANANAWGTPMGQSPNGQKTSGFQRPSAPQPAAATPGGMSTNDTLRAREAANAEHRSLVNDMASIDTAIPGWDQFLDPQLASDAAFGYANIRPGEPILPEDSRGNYPVPGDYTLSNYGDYNALNEAWNDPTTMNDEELMSWLDTAEGQNWLFGED